MYSRHMIRYGSDGKRDEYVEYFDQPLRDRIVFVCFNALWHASWKVKPLAKAINGVDQVLDKLHRRKCDGCGTVYTRLGEGKKTCVRIPLDVRLDLMHYILDNKNNITRR